MPQCPIKKRLARDACRPGDLLHEHALAFATSHRDARCELSECHIILAKMREILPTELWMFAPDRCWLRAPET